MSRKILCTPSLCVKLERTPVTDEILQKRPYRKQARAEQEAATRRTITESAVELHGTVGPARTTMSAIAEHAGVRRSTLYRHFADETAVFAACSAHWSAANPPPDLDGWAAIEDLDSRRRQALTELYGYYERNERMLGNILRDAPVMPVLAASMRPFVAYLQAVRAVLAGDGASPITIAATGHAITYSTWHSLGREQGLSLATAVEVMVGLCSAAQRL